MNQTKSNLFIFSLVTEDLESKEQERKAGGKRVAEEKNDEGWIVEIDKS
jgi:hypothetical protein